MCPDEVGDACGLCGHSSSCACTIDRSCFYAFSAASAAEDGGVGVDKLKRALAELLVAPFCGRAPTPFPGKTIEDCVSGENKSCLLLEALNKQRCLRCPCCVQSGFAGTEDAPLLLYSDHAFAVKGVPVSP